MSVAFVEIFVVLVLMDVRKAPDAVTISAAFVAILVVLVEISLSLVIELPDA